MKNFVLLLVALFLSGCSQPPADPNPSSSPANTSTPAASATPSESGSPGAADGTKRVFFANLEDGAKVKSPVAIKMGVEGMEVQPAGQDKPNSGHHHIIIDGGPLDAKTIVPADDNHIHFGLGQTEYELELSPGEHTLTLQFADYAHKSYGPDMSATIKVTVEQ